MMIRLYFVFSALAVSLMASCVQNDRQREIEERERAVALREQQMAVKERDYQELQRMRDSLEANPNVGLDTLLNKSWPEKLTGDWNSKMICRSSGCSNYVIGDQRNELWRFQTDSTGIYVKVINDEQEVRRFKGSYDGQHVTLTLVKDSTAAIRYNRRAILDHIGSRTVKGNQYLTDANNCETVFSIELTPREK